MMARLIFGAAVALVVVVCVAISVAGIVAVSALLGAALETLP